MNNISKLNHMKKFFKNMNLIIIINSEGKVLYYNDFEDRYNMLKNQNPIGKSIFDLYPWLTKENSTIFKVFKTGEPIVNEIQILDIDEKNQVKAINSAFPLKNDNDIFGALEISIDIDDKKVSDVGTNRVLLKKLTAKYSFEDFITQDKDLLHKIEKIKEAANNDSNIFIHGETGTGKELIAHAIHNASSRSTRPFIIQNCAAIPLSLMESLFFGTKEGSFTDSKDREGLFEIANGGTIVLDEINSMPYEMQAKLLRVIENKSIRRLGGKEQIQVDLRIISSTNEELSNILKGSNFRKDLFFRLNVINIKIPPLRERKCDITILIKKFIQEYNQLFNKSITSVDKDVKDLFFNYDWPGNVRELKHCIEGAFNSCKEYTITLQDLPEHLLSSMGDNDTKKISLEDKVASFEKNIISESLSSNNNNIFKTAKQLNIPRSTLYYKIKKYNIKL